MTVTLWNDYICPWAYAARSRTQWLRDQGVDVQVRSYELHPALPPGGRSIRPGGKLDQVLDHIAAECAASGLPFTKPTRSPNTHRLLAVAELVNDHFPDSFIAFDEAVALAHWAQQQAIDDDELIDELLEESGVPVIAIRQLETDGEGERLLDASRLAAVQFEATATPAWRIGELTIVGLHPQEQFQRWVTRLLSKP